MLRCGDFGATFRRSLKRYGGKPCKVSAAYICAPQQMLRCTMEFPMIAAMIRFLDAMFAPLARELDRMPPSAFRHLLAGL